MEVLFFRYDSIYESYVMDAFQKLGLTVQEDRSLMESERDDAAKTARTVAKQLEKKRYLFVFSINFFPAISDVCEIYNVIYVCWTVDVPVMTLFSPSVKNKINRIFCFDRNQYDCFKSDNPGGFFYLPLATGSEQSCGTVKNASLEKKECFRSEISFVGSTYSEKNPYRKISGMSEKTRGYLDGILAVQSLLYGVNIFENLITNEIVAEMEQIIPDLQLPICRGNERAKRYMIVNEFLNVEASQRDRERILKYVAETEKVDLYTNSDVSTLGKVRKHGIVKSFTEMPIVFHESRVNLNITMRSISSGIPMRVFDICGAGGFCLTNYQEELPELYEPGVEIETYASDEELLDKVRFYLKNESARQRIAGNGLKKTQEKHECRLRVAEMIRMLNETI